jgi:WD40-like Beta Propeller Repeat
VRLPDYHIRPLRLVPLACALVLGTAAACGPSDNSEAGPAGPAMDVRSAEGAEIFAPGVISDAREQWRITFTPDGKTAYFASSDEFFPFTRQATIYVSHLADGAWTEPEVAPFSGLYGDIDPFLSPDGRRLYFSSIRPVDGVTRGDLDIWMVERTASGWAEPVRLGPEVNSTEDELYVSASARGTLYFASGPPFPQPGKHFDIYSAAREGDGFAPRERLGPAINTEPTGAPGEGLQDAWEFNPEISVDGHILLFTSLRPGGFGLGDLYVSHLRGGEWTPARNLGPAVNSEYDEYHPTLSRDRRELFFVRRIFRPDPFLFVPGDFYRIGTRELDLR